MSLDVLVTAVNSRLHTEGFRRSRRTWNRRVGGLVDVIDLQVSKAGESVTINCGVLHPIAYEKCWDEATPAFVKEPFCTARSRVGRLGGGNDLWWQLDDERSAEGVIGALDAVFPFLDRMHDPREMANYLASQIRGKRYPDAATVAYLAILEATLGDMSRACSILDEFASKILGNWRFRLAEVADRLGCS